MHAGPALVARSVTDASLGTGDFPGLALDMLVVYVSMTGFRDVLSIMCCIFYGVI